jgi:photosystem II stability/assembly factor-like uncharacterized protein
MKTRRTLSFGRGSTSNDGAHSAKALIAVTCCVVFNALPLAAQSDGSVQSLEWSEAAPLAPQSLLLDAEQAQDQIIAVGERGHVLLSSDGGTSWTQARVPARSMLTAITTAGHNVWVVGHDAVILHSPDSGRSWSRQFYAPAKDAPLLDVWAGHDGRGLAVGAYGLALSTGDGGKRWDEIVIAPDEDHLNAIAAAPDGTLYVAAENGGVFRSRDRGATWEAVPTSYPGSLFGALALPDAVLVFGLRGHVFRSQDAGDTWIQIDTGTDATLLSGTQVNGSTLAIVGLSGMILVSRDGGRHFSSHHRPDRRGLSAALLLDTGRILLLGEHGLHHIDEGSLGGAS